MMCRDSGGGGVAGWLWCCRHCRCRHVVGRVEMVVDVVVMLQMEVVPGAVRCKCYQNLVNI
jgi:hypothetical protein